MGDALHAVDAALARAAGLEPPLRLGHTWSAGAYLADIVRAWNSDARPCELVVTRVDDRAAGLADAQVDAAVVRGELDPTRFDWVTLDDEQRVAVLPDQNIACERRAVTLSDLSDGCLIGTRVGVTTPELWPVGRRPTAGAGGGSTTGSWRSPPAPGSA